MFALKEKIKQQTAFGSIEGHFEVCNTRL